MLELLSMQICRFLRFPLTAPEEWVADKSRDRDLTADIKSVKQDFARASLSGGGGARQCSCRHALAGAPPLIEGQIPVVKCPPAGTHHRCNCRNRPHNPRARLDSIFLRDSPLSLLSLCYHSHPLHCCHISHHANTDNQMTAML